MYGTCETLCRLLREQYPAETPLNLIIWSPADIEALAQGMEYVVSEQDTRMSPCRLRIHPARFTGLMGENPPLLSPCRERVVPCM